MTLEEIFNILNIDSTKDENAIKAAYREKLKVTNPEDNPEGFKRLRAAYEAAVNYARTTEEERQEEEDDTPSGRWVKKAEAIYKNMDTRRSVLQWESLFDDDIFMSLEGEEQCGRKLLIFLMDNYYLPTEVWKLLDEKLHISQGSVRLKEMFPENFINFIVSKCQRGEDIDFSHFKGPQQGQYDQFIHCYLSASNAVAEKDFNLAKQLVEETKGLDCYHPVIALVEADIIREFQGEEAAVGFFRTVYEEYSDDLTIAFNYGDAAWKAGKKDDAAEVFKKIKEDNDEHYMSNYYLMRWYYENKDYKTAKKCGEIVMGLGGDDETYDLILRINQSLMEEYERQYIEKGDTDAAIELGWCYLQNSEPFKGLRLVEKLEVEPDKQVKYYGLLTKLYFEGAEYEKCLETALVWRQHLKECIKGEEGDELKKDQDRIYDTYSIRTASYHNMAFAKAEFFESALKETEELSYIEELGPHMLLQKAQIYIDMGKPEEAVSICEKLINEQQQFGANATLMQAYVKMLDAGGVVGCARECNYYFRQYARAYDEAARVYFELDYPDELKELIELARTNGVSSQYLDAYEYQLLNKIDKEKKPELKELLDEFDKKYQGTATSETLYQEGYDELTKILNLYPCIYMLIERGRYAMAGNKFEDAKKDFEKVLDIKPYDQFALNNMGCIYKYTGQYEKAIVCYKKAIRYMDEEPNVYPYGNLGHTYEKIGEYALAAETYVKSVELFPDTKDGAIDDIVCDYARSGQIEKALKEIKINKKNPKYVGNQFQYYKKVIEAYKDAGDIENAKMEINKALKALNRAIAMAGVRDDIMRKAAWSDLISGNIDDALYKMDSVIKSASDRTAKEAVLEEMIFMLSMVKSQPMYDIKDFASQLLSMRDKFEKNFYYRRRYGAWLIFIGTLYTAGIEEAQAAFEDMKTSMRCRHCNDCGCINLALAEALLLEKEGRYEEAMAIYENMRSKFPYDWYSMAKLIYR